MMVAIFKMISVFLPVQHPIRNLQECLLLPSVT